MYTKENNSGPIFVPFILKTTKVDINGEIVWYANKWKNFLLKIKRIFIKPKHSKLIFKKKIISTKYKLCNGK